MTATQARFRVPAAPWGARLYAALHSGNAGDVEFYLRACRGRKRLRVVELGSGAGRITFELARRGHDVVGVELDQALHALALEKLTLAQPHYKRGSVQFVHQDMVEYNSDAEFDRVLIPYSALWCLPSVEQKQRCLNAAFRLLKPHGELVLDVYSADHLRQDDAGDDSVDDDTVRVNGDTCEPIVDEFELTAHTVQLDEKTYRVFERNAWWPSHKHTRVEYGLESLGGAAEGWLMVLDHHYLWRHELAQLLDNAGFETDWGADEAAAGTPFEQQIVVRGFKL